MKNILAIQCSIPKATNAIVGNQRATTFPITSVLAAAAKTAKQTNQLQPTPRIKADIQSKEHLALVRFTMLFAQGSVPPALSKMSPEEKAMT